MKKYEFRNLVFSKGETNEWGIWLKFSAWIPLKKISYAWYSGNATIQEFIADNCDYPDMMGIGLRYGILTRNS